MVVRMGIRDWFKKEPEQETPVKKNPEGHLTHEQYIRRSTQLHDRNYTRGWKPSEVADARQELARRYHNQPEVIAERLAEEAKHREYNRLYLERIKAQEARLSASELEAKRKADLEKAKEFAKKKKTK
jgi:hypothetical protein